ncbi:acyl carrier protein [Streptomyces griseoflavus]|uniref:acyl carrier protein n=1 Tax=Streptomyces TaxID=1883 RepID=UPI0004CC1EF9|nr:MULTISPECIES: acyl carrier protein [Streptomyces]KOG51958.1 acyl carrier protein [Streptomyces griseoflavus]KOT91850.1 acyl carrier protein [Streptomyces sp. NRRL F-5755]KWT62309.1 acyl carrier protein [Streptomyces albus subsp. albus]
MNRTQKIQQFIEERFLVQFGGEVTADTDLFQAGVIDSFGYIQLMSFIENDFAVRDTDDELLSNIFVSLTDIDAFVAGLAEKHAPAGDGW